MKRTEALLVSGIGDDKPRGEHLLVGRYRRKGVNLYPFYPHWRTEPLEVAQSRLRKEAQRRTSDTGIKPVGIGYSAGGIALMLASDAFSKIVMVCTPVQNASPTSYAAKQNPAYREALRLLPPVREELRHEDALPILAIQPLHDPDVPPADAEMPGGTNQRITHFGPIPTYGHARSIGLILYFGAGLITDFAKEPMPASNHI